MARYGFVQQKGLRRYSNAHFSFCLTFVNFYAFVLIFRYDIMSGQWSKISNMSVPRSSFGVAVSNGRIYCVGGFDGVHFLRTVEKYNPKTDRYVPNVQGFW